MSARVSHRAWKCNHLVEQVCGVGVEALGELGPVEPKRHCCSAARARSGRLGMDGRQIYVTVMSLCCSSSSRARWMALWRMVDRAEQCRATSLFSFFFSTLPFFSPPQWRRHRWFATLLPRHTSSQQTSKRGQALLPPARLGRRSRRELSLKSVNKAPCHSKLPLLKHVVKSGLTRRMPTTSLS
jgi:hypothetical protein